jgi:hypothetical protein
VNSTTTPTPEPTLGPSGGVFTIDETLLSRVLEPYKKHCRYLQMAVVERESTVESLTARGEFSIPESCYIADTGHFNAVEFNICYNQLTYCLLAAAIQYKLLDVLDSWDLAEFSRRQLSDFLIVQFFSSFRSPLNARSFEGRVWIKKVMTRQTTIFMKTACTFDDGCGGKSGGEATIAILGQRASPMPGV